MSRLLNGAYRWVNTQALPSKIFQLVFLAFLKNLFNLHKPTWLLHFCFANIVQCWQPSLLIVYFSKFHVFLYFKLKQDYYKSTRNKWRVFSQKSCDQIINKYQLSKTKENNNPQIPIVQSICSLTNLLIDIWNDSNLFLGCRGWPSKDNVAL